MRRRSISCLTRLQLSLRLRPLAPQAEIAGPKGVWQQSRDRRLHDAAQFAIAAQYAHIGLCQLGCLGDELTARSARRDDPSGACGISEAETDDRNRLEGKIASRTGRGKRCSLGADRQAGRGVLEIGTGINRARFAARSRADRKQRIGRIGLGAGLLRPLNEFPVGLPELAPVDRLAHLAWPYLLRLFLRSSRRRGSRPLASRSRTEELMR